MTSTEPTYTIEKGIPLPARPPVEPPRKSDLELTAESMEIGDSFYSARHISPLSLTYLDAIGLHLEVRREGLGYRVWRVEGPRFEPLLP